MTVLADTNILLRSLPSDNNNSHYVRIAFARLRANNETIIIAPQNLIEFWSVATRPIEQNGLGLTSAHAMFEVLSLKEIFKLFPYKPETFTIWQGLVATHNVVGKQVHDAHLVALMQAHVVSKILTFNTAHFVRFPGITVLDPATASE